MSVPEWLLQLERGYLLEDRVELENAKSYAQLQREANEQFWREIGEMGYGEEPDDDEEDDFDELAPETTGPDPTTLPYQQFLRSRYWRWLSKMLKAAVNWTCEGCGEPLAVGLQVHHKTYEHRGYEWPDHLDDLEVLCDACHRAAHGLEPA